MLTSSLGQNQPFVVAQSSQGNVVLRQGHNGIKHRDTGGWRVTGMWGCAAFEAEQPLSHEGFPAVATTAAAPQCHGWVPHSPPSAPQLWVQDKGFLEGHVMC